MLHQGALLVAGVYLVFERLKHHIYYSLIIEYCQRKEAGFHLPAKAGSLPARIL